MKLIHLTATLALAACATAAPEPPREDAFYVMRHLHKADGTDPGLTTEGQGCAARLAEELAGSNIGAIYASTTRRARETAAPTAARLRLTPAEYDPRDTPSLVARVRAEPGSVLVVGHSNTVPEIVERLGGARPGDLAEDRYGEVWRVARPGGAVTVRRIAC
ncbi:MAG TPA: phosphoglycerate mutase family protein [Allosphingosinicella sp.]|nr:phosphoglycerate mutase family protein [Allosphingosinicella sp.]